MENQEFQLYNYFRSSASYRVRIALHWKNIPFDYLPVHLLRQGGEQYLDTYKKLNPLSQVPTLVHREEGKKTVISQSVAIIEYLEEIFPKRASLFPRAPELRAVVRQSVETINSGAQPFGNLATLSFIQKEYGATELQKEKWIQYWIDKALSALEQIAALHSQDYLIGSEVTAADLFLVPQLLTARRFRVDLSNFPKLLEVERKCLELQPFQLAHPEKQIDFQV